MSRSTLAGDFVVATSDRRRELRGARWDSLREGVAPSFPLSPEMDRTRLHPRFEKGVRFERHAAQAHFLPPPPPAGAAAGADLTAPEKLALLLYHSAWPQRWEPLNGCGQHRSVGTPGALFPVDLYLLAHTGQGRRVLYCSPRDLCLLETGLLPDAPDDTADALSLVIAGNLGRCVAIYGDLALWLVTLEVGMLQAQLRLVARELGWHLDGGVDHDYDAVRAQLGLIHWSEVPLLRCRLRGAAAAAAQLETAPLRTIRPLPHHAEAEAHPLMRSFVMQAAAPASGAMPVVADADNATENTFSIMQLSTARTSGLGNGIVGWSRDLGAGLLESVLADTRRLIHPSGCAAAQLTVSLVWRETQQGPVRLFGLDPVRAQMTALPCSEETRQTLRTLCRYNTALLVTIGADASLAGEASGARRLLDVNLQAGALAQCFSLAAARNGLSARLFMAYPDAIKNLLMPLDRRALVQIMIGFDPRPNPAFTFL